VGAQSAGKSKNAVLKLSNMMKRPLNILAAVSNQEVKMRGKINLPFALFLNPVDMARRTETAGAAGKHKQPLLSAFRAPCPSNGS
jgi:hypothetical protein